jgi:hypothetical protein
MGLNPPPPRGEGIRLLSGFLREWSLSIAILERSDRGISVFWPDEQPFGLRGWRTDPPGLEDRPFGP